MIKFDLTTDWSEGIFEVWKGQTKALIQIVVVMLLFAGVTYLFNSNLWKLGVAVTALLIATFVMMSLTAGMWILVGMFWSKYVPENYHVTNRLRKHPIKTRTGSIGFFTLMFFALLYFTYNLSPDASVIIGADGDPVHIGLRGFMYVVLGILGLLLASMWKEHIDIVRKIRDSDRDVAEELEDGSE